MSRAEELLRSAARALRSVAKLSVRWDRNEATPWCSVCLRAALNGKAIEHAESCAVGAAFAVAEDLEREPFDLPVVSDTEISAMRLTDDSEPQTQPLGDLFVGVSCRRGATFVATLVREIRDGDPFYHADWFGALLGGDDLCSWLHDKVSGACAVGFDAFDGLGVKQLGPRAVAIPQSGASLTPSLREIAFAQSSGRLDFCSRDRELARSIAEAKVVPSAAGQSKIVNASPQFRALVNAMAASFVNKETSPSRSPGGILSSWPPPSKVKVSAESNFITGNPSRFIEYQDGRDEAARIALHEEVAGQ